MEEKLSKLLKRAAGDAHLEKCRETRRMILKMPYTPQFHFWAPEGRLNDPNGLCFHDGLYHMFYQAVPSCVEIGEKCTPKFWRDRSICWGHTVSEDLIHWYDLPIAISPIAEKHIFSGNTLVEENRVIAMFHSAGGSGNNVAISEDPGLLHFQRLQEQAVLTFAADTDAQGYPYRIFDPFLWKEEDGYYSLSGCYFGAREDGTTCQDRMSESLFYSADLRNWKYLGQLMPENPYVEIGNDGACPYFLPLGDRYVLFFFSHSNGANCLVGDYDRTTHHFYPKRRVKFNYGRTGNSLNAPCAMSDGRGGIYLVFNINDNRTDLRRNGMISSAIYVTLEEKTGLPMFRPISGYQALYKDTWQQRSLKLLPLQERTLDFRSDCATIQMRLDMKTSRAVTVHFFRSMQEYTALTVYRQTPEGETGTRHGSDMYVCLDTTRSSTETGNIQGKCPELLPLERFTSPVVEITLVIDKCIAEVFINNHFYITQPCYPASPDSKGLSVEAIGGEAEVLEITCHNMKGIYDSDPA